jgi:hypothetical protein
MRFAEILRQVADALDQQNQNTSPFTYTGNEVPVDQPCNAEQSTDLDSTPIALKIDLVEPTDVSDEIIALKKSAGIFNITPVVK